MTLSRIPLFILVLFACVWGWQVGYAVEAQKNKASAKASPNLPYLGPGADTLKPEEYVKTYSDYIKESIRMGFPPSKCESGACEQALAYLFRSAGLFTYPIPSNADVNSWKHSDGIWECYESGGALAQVERDKSGALLSGVLILSKSPKALKALVRACREKPLRIERDPKTGLEKIAGVPVGYPHPLLCVESQGLIVEHIQFNGDHKDCRPIYFTDNSWVNHLALSEESCTETQHELNLAWTKKISPSELAKKIRMRQEKRIRTIVKKHGGGDAEVKSVLRQYYSGPIGHDITLVGTAMRELEYCNQLHLGKPWAKGGSPQNEDAKPSKGIQPNVEPGK